LDKFDSLVKGPYSITIDGPPLLITNDFIVDHAELFLQLKEEVPWDERMAARKTASFGRPYNYSQISYPTTPLPPSLESVADRLLAALGIHFNNCLLNYYEMGDNTMGFHSDDTNGLHSGTGVAIVSLGSVRNITFRHKTHSSGERSYPLEPGSLLYMDAAIQTDWLHAIRRQASAGPRISLTWRAFV
jgi:alkylated DNA repair dioxygenase AlkB